MTIHSTESARPGPAKPAANGAHVNRYPGPWAVAAMILALGIGMVMCIVQPALNAPDEDYHWQRAVQVSHGQWLADRYGEQDYGGNIDLAALEFARWANAHFQNASAFSLSQARQISAALENSPGMAKASFPSSATFSPLVYLPQAAGIAVARQWGGGVFEQMIAGRMANLLVYLVLMASAIGVAPRGQPLLVLLAVTAPALHLAASVSADPLNIALPALLFAWCLRLRLDETSRLTRRSLWVLGLMLVSLSLLKPIYVLLSGMALLVPVRHFGSARERRIFLLATIGAGLARTLAWNAAYPFMPGRYWGTGADPKAVLLHIIQAPRASLAYFFQSLQHQLPIMWIDGWGRMGGYPPPFMLNAPKALSWAALATMLAIAAFDGADRRDLRASAFMATLAVVFTCVIFLAFWLTFSPPGSAVIQGVQGRYFQLAFLLTGWALVCAAPFGAYCQRLVTPLFIVGLTLQMASLVQGIEAFRFYWIN